MILSYFSKLRRHFNSANSVNSVKKGPTHKWCQSKTISVWRRVVFTDISPWPQASFLEVQKGNTIDSHYSGETKDHPKAIENLKAWSYQKKVHLLAM